MPLDKLVLILIAVIAAAALTVWLAALLTAATEFPALGALAAVPTLLAVYIGWRVLAQRLHNRDDDRYDRIDR